MRAFPDTILAKCERWGQVELAHWPFWLPVLLATGIGLYFLPAAEPPIAVGIAAAIIAVLALIGSIFAPYIGLRIALALITALCCGLAAAQWRSYAVAAPVIADGQGTIAVTGRLLHVETRPQRWRLTLIDLASDDMADATLPTKIRVTIAASRMIAAGLAPLQVGDRVAMLVRLRPPSLPVMPGAYDFARAAWFQQMGGQGFILGDVTLLSPTVMNAAQHFWVYVNKVRQQVATIIRENLPEPTGSFAAALLTGDRSGIPETVVEAMRDAGLAHLLAISGLHVGLATGIVFVALRFILALIPYIALRLDTKKVAAIGALIAALIYLFLAGATISTQRATLMCAVALGAILLDRQAISLRTLGIAAAAILLWRPESLLQAGFQMSFAAVAALIAGYEALQPWLYRRGETPDWRRRLTLFAIGILATTIIAGLASAPYAVFHFNRWVNYGIAGNLLAVPVMSLWIMPWAVVALLLMPLGLAGLALAPMGWGIDAVVAVAAMVSTWPAATQAVSAMPLSALLLITFAGLLLCLLQSPLRLLGLLPLSVGLILAATARPPDVLISADAKALLLRESSDRGRILGLRRDSFRADIWQRRLGLRELTVWGRQADPGCDAWGCQIQLAGRQIAYVRDPQALPEDCRRTDILIIRFTVPEQCQGPDQIWDWRTLRQSGAVALWLDDDLPRWRAVKRPRPDRLWHRYRADAGRR